MADKIIKHAGNIVKLKKIGPASPQIRPSASPAAALAAASYAHSKEKRMWWAKNELVVLLIWVIRIVISVLKALLQILDFVLGSLWGYLTRHPVHAIFNLGLACLVCVLVITGSKLHYQLIQQKRADVVVSNLIEASEYTRKHTLGNIQSRGLREFLRVGGPPWMQEESIKTILYHARKAKLSLEHQAVLLATANVESGFNPMARASTTTACGLFQFIRATGKKFGLKNSECLDPWLNTQAGIAHYVNNYRNYLDKRVKDLSGSDKVLKMFELSYYMHHDGSLSTARTNELKATVLTGTSYLFKAYEILQNERKIEEESEGFYGRLVAEFQSITGTLKKTLYDTENLRQPK